MTAPLLRYQKVALGYGGVPLLEGITLEVRRGDFLGIVGPNGAGKTTLLKSAIGLLAPLRGRIDWPSGPQTVGYVPQRQALDSIYPLRVHDVVAMGLYHELGWLRRLGRQQRARVQAALVAAGVERLAGRHYRELSGGQQQRCLIARALVGNPALLVLDEPTNDLDIVGETRVMELVAELHTRAKTVLMVSHQLRVVCRYVQQLALIHSGRMVAGAAASMLRSERLSEVYGIPLRVETLHGRPVVVPEGGSDAR